MYADKVITRRKRPIKEHLNDGSIRAKLDHVVERQKALQGTLSDLSCYRQEVEDQNQILFMEETSLDLPRIYP